MTLLGNIQNYQEFCQKFQDRGYTEIPGIHHPEIPGRIPGNFKYFPKV